MNALVTQRHPSDCGIAALATYTNIRYEDVYMAAVQTDKRIPKTGMDTKQLVAVAKRLGRHLEPLHWQRVDVENDEGILGVNWNDPKAHAGVKGHWVVLLRGLIIDPWDSPPTVREADEYLAINGGRKGTLYREVTRKSPRKSK